MNRNKLVILAILLCSTWLFAQEDRIVGGTEVDPPYQYTWMAAVFPGPYLCGGSLIHEEWILTAAHCVEDIAAEDTEVVLGAHYLWNASENPGVRITMGVTDIYIHSGYNNSTYDNDLALLHLDGAAPDDFTPVSLIDDPSLDDAGEMARVMGWGDTSWGGDLSNVLMEVDVPIISNAVCSDPSHYGGGITSNMICAGDIVDGGEDSCQGDSGGPLLVHDGSEWQQVGIVSWGIGCAQPAHPGVYTRVNNYLPWINGYLPDTDILGCMNPAACNYDPDATTDDGSCEYVIDCNDECGGSAFVNECGCVEGTTGNDADFCYGCTDDTALNFDPGAWLDDGSCVYPSSPVTLFVGDASMQAGGTALLDISMENDDPVGGFQFSLVFENDMAHLVEVFVTDRTAGWQVSGNSSNGTIVGFNLSGLVIEPGSGPIVTVEIMGDVPGIGEACLVDPVISDAIGSQIDAFAYCGTISIGVIELFVGDASVGGGGSGMMDISMTNEGPVAGFQFTLAFEPEIGEILDVVTTPRTEGWQISASPASGVIIGFNLSGVNIEPGEGPIASVLVLGNDPGTADACLSEIVLSNPGGSNAPAIAECGELTVGATEMFVGDAEVYLNQQGEISISISNEIPVAGFQFDLIIDPAIATVVGVSATDRTPGWQISNGGNTIIGFSLQGIDIEPGTGPVAFVTLSGDLEGQASVCLDEIVLSGEGGFVMPAVGFCGILDVFPGMKGDLNQDGELNVIDIVSLVEVILSGIATDYQLWAADVNSDGDVNVIDIVSLVELILNPPVFRSIPVTGAEVQLTGDAMKMDVAGHAAGIQLDLRGDVQTIQVLPIDGWINEFSGNTLVAASIDGSPYNGEVLFMYSGDISVASGMVADWHGGSVQLSSTNSPTEFSLISAYPNPFNPVTTINYNVPTEGIVRLNIFDLNGRHVSTLVNSYQPAGVNSVQWDAMHMPSGIYLVQLQSDTGVETLKLLLTK